MTAKSNATRSNFGKVDTHAIAPQEYDEIPELTDNDLHRARLRIGGKQVTRDEFLAAVTVGSKSRAP